MWGDGEEPQSSPPLRSTDSIWSCSVQFTKNTFFLIQNFRSHPTKNWGPIWEHVEKVTGDLLTRTCVKLPTVLLNQVGSRGSVLEFKDSSTSGFLGTKAQSSIFVSKITNGNFYFPISSTFKHCSVEKGQAHKCCTKSQSHESCGSFMASDGLRIVQIVEVCRVR